jgi:acyl-CoA thioester hydrolase
MSRIKLALPDRWTFSTELPVRISDINYGGHLGNDAVLALAQEARVRFLMSHGYSEKNVEGAGLIMVDAVVVYRSEAFYGDVLVVDVALADPQPLGCDVLYRFTNKATGKEVARVKTGVAFFDYTRRRPVEMPEGFMRIAGSPEAGRQGGIAGR